LFFRSGRLVVIADAVNTFFDFLANRQLKIVTVSLLLLIQRKATVDCYFHCVHIPARISTPKIPGDALPVRFVLAEHLLEAAVAAATITLGGRRSWHYPQP
jgi:hypothetical protein